MNIKNIFLALALTCSILIGAPLCHKFDEKDRVHELDRAIAHLVEAVS